MVLDLEGAELFFRTKPVRAIIALLDEKREWYASSLAKETDCTFPHVIKILSIFEDLGMVSFKIEGRKKLIFLTPKGKRAASSFEEVLAVFK